MTRRRVALTGIGAVTPLGVGVDALWGGLREGRSGVRPARGVDLDGMPVTHYAQLPGIDWDAHLDPKASALWADVTKLTVVAGQLAVDDAGAPPPPERTGTILGTGYAGTYEFEELYRTFFDGGWKRLKPVTVPKLMPNAAASHLAIRFGARGINFTVSTACSSGAIAAGLAVQQIRAGAIDACLTGGADAIFNASTVGAWNRLRVLSRENSPEASRPFSKGRQGLVFGEGAALFVLEEWERAVARGARVYAEIAGVGATNDAVNIVGPDATGEIEAVRAALADAGVAPEAVGYVNAHGTGTAANDANETAVLKEVFGTHARTLPVSSVKGHLGHTMGAAGAIELAVTALTLREQLIIPTRNFVPGDPACDLDYVPDGPRPADVEYALTNSFGFGGQNSALLLRRYGAGLEAAE